MLAKSRYFLRHTARDLTDEQAGLRTTASALCIGGLIKHVTAVERGWAAFIVEGPASVKDAAGETEEGRAEREDGFRMLPGDTLAGVLKAYEEAADATDELVRTLPDLGVTWPLPEAPWTEPGTEWSLRGVLLHIGTETAQHAGHADILRETLDGAQSMA
ncbi:DinB family protein [Streptomyces sp. NBC_00237]|uniref:DinB family protein n=1 Tax=Streptomyces sp. NBC_00237 TaxID=2975687 RepID=UPI0022560FE3|nr:DinB family protein [Streptomyces sp. NBC_00237]MCX5201370.1 DinB family protein [Streptomyces sp. NBC_00237]